jgi:uncharacterized protein YcfJ
MAQCQPGFNGVKQVNMKLIIAGIVGALAVTAIGAIAGYRTMDAKDSAEVVSVKQATRTVSVPRQECHNELVSTQHPTQDPNRIAGTVAGAVVGGVVGSQIGSGSGKKVATVGGVVAGGVAGNKIQEGMQERNVDQEWRQVCVTVQDTREEPAGYDVTYRLDDRQTTVRTDYDPGKRIALKNGAPVLLK